MGLVTTSRPRTYGQECAVAMALDRVGDRWSLLIVRELLAGPARFTDLAIGLDGVAPNLLSARLKRLSELDVIETCEVFGRSMYQLTTLGEGLRPAVQALGLWGATAGPLPGSTPAPIASARSAAFGFETVLAMASAPVDPLLVGVRVGDEVLEVRVGGSEPVSVRAAVGGSFDATVVTTLEALSALPVAGLGRQTMRASSHRRADKHAAATLIAMVTEGLRS